MQVICVDRYKSDKPDLKDYHRETSPQPQAEDTIELNTDHLSSQQVQTRIVQLCLKSYFESSFYKDGGLQVQHGKQFHSF